MSTIMQYLPEITAGVIGYFLAYMFEDSFGGNKITRVVIGVVAAFAFHFFGPDVKETLKSLLNSIGLSDKPIKF